MNPNRFNISFLISIFLSNVIYAPGSFAGSPMDQAQETVRATIETARAKANEAVVGDFNFAMSQVMNSLLTQPDLAPLASSLIEKQKDLYKEMLAFENLNPNQVAQLKSKALAAYDQYKTIARDRFDFSFQVAELREQNRQALRMSASMLQQFVSNCKTGRGIGGIGEKAFNYPTLPKADFGIYVSNSSGDLHYSGTGSSDEKSRNEIAGGATVIASNVSLIAYSGAGASSGVAMCAVAAPYLLAGAAVVAVAVAYLNAQDRIKLENEIVAAEIYAFEKTATDLNVAHFYREQCSDLSKGVAPLINSFVTAANSPQDLESLAGASDFTQDMDNLSALLKTRIDLQAKLDALKKLQDAASLQAKQSIAVDLKKIEIEVSKITTPEHITQMAVSVLLKQRDTLETQLREINFNQLDRAQGRAFDNLMNILTLVQRKEFSKYLLGDDALGLELAAAKKFSSARLLFRETLSLQIQFIFGKATSAQVSSEQAKLAAATRDLLNQFASVKEVASFAMQVRQLIGHY